MGTQVRTGYVRVPCRGSSVEERGIPNPRVAGSTPALGLDAPPAAPRQGAAGAGHRRRTSWGFWRRVALRALGVPFGMQNTLLDERRWSITVSGHAVKQAGERYRQGDPKHITRDVADALCENRVGEHAPGRRSRAYARAVLAWNDDLSRVYVIRRIKRGWLVVTALPTDASDAAAALRIASTTDGDLVATKSTDGGVL